MEITIGSRWEIRGTGAAATVVALNYGSGYTVQFKDGGRMYHVDLDDLLLIIPSTKERY
jgi:hypothetical protein